MTTRHLVDPELLAMADNFPPMMLSDESLPAIRANENSPRAFRRAFAA